MHWMVAAVLGGIVLVLGIILLGGDTAQGAGARFMAALAKRDVATLTDLTYIEGRPKEDIQKQWEFATDVAQHYRFRYLILGQMQSDPTTASVRMQIWRNYGPGSYEENFSLPMKRVDGRWMVDVTNWSRGAFPALPR